MSQKHDDYSEPGSAPHIDVEDSNLELGEVFPPEGKIAATAEALNDAAGDQVTLVQWAGDRFTAPQWIIDKAKLPEASTKASVANPRAATSSASADADKLGVNAEKAPAERRTAAKSTAAKAGRGRQKSEVADNAKRDGGKPAEKLDPAGDGAEDLGQKTT